MTEEEITTATALPAERVTAVAKIAKSATAQTVAEKFDLTFDQALGLAEFDTDKEIVKELTVIAKQRPHDFDHTLERFRQNRAKAEALEAETKAWDEKGYAVLDTRPSYDDKKCVDIDYLRLNDKATAPRVTPKNHAECPGRAVRIGVNWDGDTWVEEYCTDWKANGHADNRGGGAGLGGGRGSTASAGSTKSEAEQTKEKLERRTNLACIAAGKAAEVVRRKFVSDLIARKTPPPAVLPFAIGAVLTHHIEDEGQTFAALTGVPAPTAKWSGTLEAQVKFLSGRTQAQLPLALFARVAAHVEGHWEPNTWKIMGDAARTLRRSYLELLTTVGYTPALIELVQLGKAKPDAVLAEVDKEKAVAKANKTTEGAAGRARAADAAKAAPTKATAPTKAAPAKRATKKRPAKRVAKKRAPGSSAARR
jgi:ParB family chromosome partitioning protein